MKEISIVIVDDHPLLRQAVSGLLSEEPDFKVVGEAGSGEEAVELVTTLKPSLVIMDIGLPGMSGIEATREIKATLPETAVLALTIYDSDEYVYGLIDAGAAGYLLKSAWPEEIVHAARAVASGEMVLDTEIGHRLLKKASQQSPHDRQAVVKENVLSDREMRVVELCAKGLSNKEIAKELSTGVFAVKACLNEIFAKLRVGSRIEAILVALKAGWLSPDDLM